MSVQLTIVLVCAVAAAAYGQKFPPGFKFGAATASYQIEGAWNISDKTAHIWDTFSHIEGNILNGDTGDVACDSYHRWQRDIEMAKELGLHFYRFSVSWTRILPKGYDIYISKDGKSYYSDLIDGLVKAKIEPVVTLYHWDLPQNLQDLGGWTNSLIVDWFEDYARVVFDLYGNRVRTWLTINEPITFCSLGYHTGTMAPGVNSPEVGYYLCIKNVMLAHARVWRLYDREYKPKQNGKVSLANNIIWYEPATPADKELTELVAQYGIGCYSHPIFSKEGGWPPSIEKALAEYSKRVGYRRSILPPFTEEEKKLVRGTYDFLGLNHYTSRLVKAVQQGETAGPWPFDGVPELDAIFTVDSDWPETSSPWFWEYPEGIRKTLNWYKQQYGDFEIIISENGYSSKGNNLNDDARVNYYESYLKQVLLAIKEDSVNVTGYTAWSLMDNFEWIDGYQCKFGLYEVDFEHPEQKRTQRKSAKYYASIIKAHSLLPAPKDEL